MSILGRLARALAWLPPLLASVSAASALDDVTVQLKWRHQFQFAGYYAALEQGYYYDAGLNVRIAEGGPTIDAVAELESGRADFAVGTSGVLLDRAAGKDLVVLAVIFQHSPAVLLSLRRSGIRTLADVAGKRLMDAPASQDLEAMLKKQGIDYAGLPRVEHQGDPTDLVDGKADVMVAYSTNEPFVLERLGEAYSVFTPRALGIDLYGDNLVTTSRKIAASPAQVEAFRRASLRGWRYALDHKAEVVELILSRYSRAKSGEALLFEAEQTAQLIQADLVDLGYQSEARWRHVAEVYASLGMLPPDVPVGGILYDPRRGPDDRRLWTVAALLLGLALALGLVAALFVRLNHRLRSQVAEHQRARAGLARSETVKSHLAALSTTLQKAAGLAELAQSFLSFAIPLVAASVGAVYVVDGDSTFLRRVGSHGAPDPETEGFAEGQGLVGQCAHDGQPMVVTAPADTRLHVRLGCGELIPAEILLLPVIHYQRVLGVVELAFLDAIDADARAMLEEFVAVLATTLEILGRNLYSRRRLEDTEAWFRAIVASAPDGMLVVDEAGLIMMANPRLEAMFGYGDGELAGQPVEILLPSAARDRHVEHRGGFMRHGHDRPMGLSTGDQMGLHRDGSPIPLEISLSRLPQVGGRGCCVCASVRGRQPAAAVLSSVGANHQEG